MLYIGVDLGTSAVKLLLMDSEGKIQNIVSREYPSCWLTVIGARWRGSASEARCTGS